MKPRDAEAKRLAEILDRLAAQGPLPKPGLAYRSPWECVAATLLSAQCTDEQVNRVTPGLFAAYPGPAELARAPVAEVERLIHSVGLFRTKAQNLVKMAQRVVERHGGRVPADRDALEALPGVGRKTASVVLSQAFGIPAFAVDTHVGRLCRRLGFTAAENPLEVERCMTALMPPERWRDAHLLLIRHGRRICHAKKPDHAACPVADLCPSRP